MAMSISQPLSYALTLALGAYVIHQARRPTRWFGQLYAWVMGFSHSRLTDWGLAHATVEKRFTILDVGCGGGRTIRKLAAAATEGRVHGVDYSGGSVAAARRTNARLIEAGRVDIRQASVSDLPFPDGTFDLVTAVETQYYWPDLAGDMRQVLRVLKPGGRLVVILESYKGNGRDLLHGPAMALLRAKRLSVDEQRNLLATAGFTDVQVFEDRRHGWLTATGQRPT